MTIKMEVKGIIFDLDGTLVDSIEDLGDAANALFEKHGYPTYEKEDFIKWIGNGAAKFIQEGIGSVIDKNILKDYVAEFKEIYMCKLTEKSKLYDGVKILLDELSKQNVKMSVLSNKPHLHTQKMASYFLDSWTFESIDGQKDDVPRKPDPTSALTIAENMGIEPGNILFIGDSAGDIRTALSAGMIPVWVSWGYGDPDASEKSQTIIVTEPEEILSLLI
ncbi:HAD family hydrolase [Bacteroidota bacterium]